MTSTNHYPDGLDEQAIDLLIAEVDAELANLARRICRTCGKDPLYVVPTSTRQCWVCFETADLAEAA